MKVPPPLIDARRLHLIGIIPIGQGRTYMLNHAQSIAWHHHNTQPCQCHTLHGHCYAVTCPCPRHVGETQ